MKFMNGRSRDPGPAGVPIRDPSPAWVLLWDPGPAWSLLGPWVLQMQQSSFLFSLRICWWVFCLLADFKTMKLLLQNRLWDLRTISANYYTSQGASLFHEAYFSYIGEIVCYIGVGWLADKTRGERQNSGGTTKLGGNDKTRGERQCEGPI